MVTLIGEDIDIWKLIVQVIDLRNHRLNLIIINIRDVMIRTLIGRYELKFD